MMIENDDNRSIVHGNNRRALTNKHKTFFFLLFPAFPESNLCLLAKLNCEVYTIEWNTTRVCTFLIEPTLVCMPLSDKEVDSEEMLPETTNWWKTIGISECHPWTYIILVIHKYCWNSRSFFSQNVHATK